MPQSNGSPPQVLTRSPSLPAAWTTNPSVVVILELPDLAASGSETVMRKANIMRTNKQIMLEKKL